MSEYAIEVENLCIKYKQLQSYSIKQSLIPGFRRKAEYFEAVKNVSFRVEKGDIVGIVGTNGSGKSTMLRAIAGIFAPNSGRIDLHGNTVSLLAIGVGFQRELTGRENILLSGMLLGFTEKQVKARMADIIRFSELGKFIDLPVRTYSSGMQSKLAFSVTATLETDIMLIDELLSVGDMRFRQKSFKKMRELIADKDRTVMIVSHDKRTIANLCNKVLWINDGEVVRYGDTAEILEEYERFMMANAPVAAEKTVTYEVEAKQGVNYQWQFRMSCVGNWRMAQALGNATPAIHVPQTANRNGYQYRCVMTDAKGNVTYSQIYTLTVDIPAKPES